MNIYFIVISYCFLLLKDLSGMNKCPLEEFTKFFFLLEENNKTYKKELQKQIKEEDDDNSIYHHIEEDIDNMRENNNYMEDEIDNLKNMIYNKKEDIKKKIKKNNNHHISRNEKKLIKDLKAIKDKIININSEFEPECDIVIKNIIMKFKEVNKILYEIKDLKTNNKKFKLVINKMNKRKSIIKKNHNKLLDKVNRLKAMYKALDNKFKSII